MNNKKKIIGISGSSGKIPKCGVSENSNFSKITKNFEKGSKF